MPRRSRTQITKELAVKIVSKLEAVELTTRGAAHDIYGVYHEDVLVARFGIRRGSRKDAGHDHIPGELGVSVGFARLLAQCPKSRDDYLRQIGATPES